MCIHGPQKGYVRVYMCTPKSMLCVCTREAVCVCLYSTATADVCMLTFVLQWLLEMSNSILHPSPPMCCTIQFNCIHCVILFSATANATESCSKSGINSQFAFLHLHP
ncbi:hypothetical protein KIL84_003113 [Mauremys mutica]|uniref:Uncharacterized protein n=1 Tax=Mauremys mutica TaxID=74926 RepID=A0A9D3WV36_9SAUR|nr:hypothetical protein KIL84_003113 [Mauremys mutica]